MITMRILLITIIICTISSCASIPPEFVTAMEKERDGIKLLKQRHTQTVSDLVDSWYDERLSRLIFFKQIEIKKVTIVFPNPDGGNGIEVLEKEGLLKIERQFDEAVKFTNIIRVALIKDYSDADNWDKLQKLNTINLDMTRSLLELNQAQRKFYSELVGDNVPYPSDLINDKTKEILNKINN